MRKTNKNTQYRNSNQARRSARFSVELGAPLIFCTLEAIVLAILCLVINTAFKTEDNAAVISLISILLLPFYVCSAGIICLIYISNSQRVKKARLNEKMLETEIYDIFRYIIDLPYAVIDSQGKVRIINGALQDILGIKRAVSGIDLSEICSVSAKTVMAFAKNRDAYVSDTVYDRPENTELQSNAITPLADGRRYEANSYVFKTQGESFYFIVFRDVESYLSLYEKYEAEDPAVAYIQLDNLQELSQYVRADHRSASADAENILRDWVASMNGFIREYSRDKYVAVFSKSNLVEQMKNDFEIQKKIMSLKIGDNSFPVTVSMGISAVGDSLGAKDNSAHHALNMAIQRGGNQVAIRREDETGYVFFGGTHKTIENNTTIVSRVTGELLESKIATASNVLIMGHSNPDFDSVGSCVGMARLAMSVKQSVGHTGRINVVIDKNAESFVTCYEQLEPMGIYHDVFIGREVAKDLVNPDTLLIICDVNNPRIYEAPELVHMVKDIAVIDHHRLAEALPFNAFLQYVEATKSSASEIVAEILYYSKFGDELHKEEAEVLLAGIMLDTQNFTRNAGAQTFEITRYLYSRGAHTGVVREFFNESLDELLLTGEFESKARIYRNDVAITWMTLDRPASSEDRIIAAKVADNLLKVKGVKASFALIKIDSDVVISGRSKGAVNVQLILERLKGGGHFDIAGAQIKHASLTRACEMLKDAIDDYFEYDHHN